jgi:hypothetical protein
MEIDLWDRDRKATVLRIISPFFTAPIRADLEKGMLWLIFIAFPSARLLSTSISTISENNPISIRANAQAAPT